MKTNIMITPAAWLEPYSPGQRASLKARAQGEDSTFPAYLMESGHVVDQEGWVMEEPMDPCEDHYVLQVDRAACPIYYSGERIVIIMRSESVPIDIQQVTMPFAIYPDGTRVERDHPDLAVFNVGNIDANP